MNIGQQQKEVNKLWCIYRNKKQKNLPQLPNMCSAKRRQRADISIWCEVFAFHFIIPASRSHHHLSRRAARPACKTSSTEENSLKQVTQSYFYVTLKGQGQGEVRIRSLPRQNPLREIWETPTCLLCLSWSPVARFVLCKDRFIMCSHLVPHCYLSESWIIKSVQSCDSDIKQRLGRAGIYIDYMVE